MKKTNKKAAPNFFNKNKDLLIVSGAIVLLAGAGITWFYVKNKKEKLAESNKATAEIVPISVAKKSTIIPRSKSLPSTSSSSGYPIKYGSRHTDVKILQRYLKIYKADLGNTGSKRDGVDGIFGPKTAREAKKQLGKSVFTLSDINGMRKALKTLGK